MSKMTIVVLLAGLVLAGSSLGIPAETMLDGNHPEDIWKSRITTRFLGDKINDYWPDDPLLPTDPQLSKIAQSFILKKASTISRIELYLYGGEESEEGVKLRIETDESKSPSGFLVHPDAIASIPATKGASIYHEFVFKKELILEAGLYWIVLEKPTEDPRKYICYFVPVSSYEDITEGSGGDMAEWENQGPTSKTWHFYGGWDMYFGVYGQEVK